MALKISEIHVLLNAICVMEATTLHKGSIVGTYAYGKRMSADYYYFFFHRLLLNNFSPGGTFVLLCVKFLFFFFLFFADG